MEIEQFDIILVVGTIVVVIAAITTKMTTDPLVYLVVGGFLALLKGVPMAIQSFTTQTQTDSNIEAGTDEPTETIQTES